MSRTWNKLPLISFLRHLLFLLHFLKLVGNLIGIYETGNLALYFKRQRLVPMNVPAPVYYSIQIAMDLCINLSYSLHTVALPISIVGFCSIIWLHTHPDLNFALGVIFLCWAQVELALFCNFLAQNSAYDILIRQFYSVRFERVNNLDFVVKDDDIELIHEIFLLSYFFDGWNPLSTGSYEDHLYIDYFQTISGCCGWSGRQFWKIPVPKSCCPLNYVGNCTLMKATKKPCQTKYKLMDEVQVRLTAEYFIFFLFSLWIGATCVYLERVRRKYLKEVLHKKTMERAKQ